MCVYVLIWVTCVLESDRVPFDTPGRLRDGLLEDKVVGWYSLIADDKPLKSTLAETSMVGDQRSIYVTCFTPDDTAHDYRLLDWAIIAASLLKISEAVALYRMGSSYLCWSTMIGSACCWVFAVLLQTLNAGRDSYENLDDTADSLIGDLPSYRRFGVADKNIILGQPVSVRRGSLWRTAWIVSAIANAVGLGITFYVLAKEVEKSAALIYVWLSFQILWVFLRTFMYHMIPESRGAPNLNLSPQPLECLPATSQTRVLRLLLAASLLQTHEHVRCHEAYLEDIQSMSSPGQLIGALEQAGWRISVVLPDQINQALSAAKIEAVIGEGVLRTFAWISEAKIDNAEIYDAVSVLFRASSGERYLVPGVRVMGLKPTRLVARDPEANAPSFDPRGTVNREKSQYWIYWFPIQSTSSSQYSWLEIRCDPFSVLGGLHGYRVLTDMALEKELAAGALNISLRGTADMMSALKASRACSHLLLEMVKSLCICRTK